MYTHTHTHIFIECILIMTNVTHRSGVNASLEILFPVADSFHFSNELIKLVIFVLNFSHSVRLFHTSHRFF